MRAIDIHVHPMTQAYADASALFMPAAQRMFGARFSARPEADIVAEFRRDDVLAMPIAWDSAHGTGDPVFTNEDVAGLSARHPDVFLPGWGMVDPWRGRAGLQAIEHAIKGLGLKGIKYQPPVQAFAPSDRMFYPIWDLLQDLGAPVLIHSGTTAIGAGEPGGLGFKLEYARPIPHLDNIAADFPRLNIVAAHPGWPFTEELIAVALHKGNVSIDVSGWGPKYIPPALKHEMSRRLQDKVMFGSDYPGWSPGQTCDEWEMQGFKPGITDKLFRDNILRILGLHDAVRAAQAVVHHDPEGTIP